MRARFLAFFALFLGPAADAKDVAYESGDFVVARSSTTVHVLQAGIPDAVLKLAVEGLPEGYDGPAAVPTSQYCRVRFAWDVERAQVVPTAYGCNAATEKASLAAAARWSLALVPSPTTNADLFDVWYVFPDGKPAQMAIGAVAGAELAAIPPDLPVVKGVEVRHRESVPYPASLPKGVAGDAVCDVNLQVDETGTPYRVERTGCDAAFQGALVDGLIGWRFIPAAIGDTPIRTAVPLSVKFMVDASLPAGGSAGVTFLNPADAAARFQLGVAGVGVVAALAREEDPFVPVPLPDHPPVLVLDHGPYAPVKVYSLDLPPPIDGAGECALLVQVNSARRVWAWPETPCDEHVREAAVAAVTAWPLEPGKPQPGEYYARFRVRLSFAGGAVSAVIAASDIVADPERPLPATVTTFVPPALMRQVPPKRPEGLEGPADCKLAVHVSAGGRPTAVEPDASCPEPAREVSVKAVKKWQWAAGRIADRPVEMDTTVTVKFR